MLWWRAGRSRPPPDSSGSERSMRACTSPKPTTRSRAAASSIASGTPSRRTQMSRMSARSSSPATNPGSAWRALVANNVTAAGVTASVANGANQCSTSTLNRNSVRLVASTVSSGQLASRSPTIGTACGRCSILSSTRSNGPGAIARTIASRIDVPPTSTEPTRVAISASTRSALSTRPSSTRSASPLLRPSTAFASDVLPTPPGPVMVTKRWPTSSRCTVARSVSRPISALPTGAAAIERDARPRRERANTSTSSGQSPTPTSSLPRPTRANTSR